MPVSKGLYNRLHRDVSDNMNDSLGKGEGILKHSTIYIKNAYFMKN